MKAYDRPEGARHPARSRAMLAGAAALDTYLGCRAWPRGASLPSEAFEVDGRSTGSRPELTERQNPDPAIVPVRVLAGIQDDCFLQPRPEAILQET